MADYSITGELRRLPARAAQFIRRYPVPKRGTYGPESRISVQDVLLHCATVRGDAFVAFQLMRRQGLPGAYFLHLDVLDDALRTLDGFEVTEHECEQTFGPSWRQVVLHAIDAADVVHAHFGQLDTADSIAGNRRRLNAWLAARDAAWEAGLIKAWYRAQEAAGESRYMDDVSLHIDDRRCGDLTTMVRDAAAAVALSDSLGQFGFTREHFETLLEPWQAASQVSPRVLPRESALRTHPSPPVALARNSR
ncbi:hypothetical protein ACFTZB_04035 [Rhodococcus sp. NPDC057014]|uniref:hypothetical protein n=1 Tax=Rhodococcus sp. NPDC057014 TaxID=3346000 RepID=UPI00362B3014